MAIEIAPPEPVSPEARKRRRAIGVLWRLSGWGGAAAIALAALAITTQTEGGSQRLQLAFNFGSPPAPAADLADLKRHALEKDAETRALAAQVITLAADRDRLTARIASLEHNLDDMTGSIKRQAPLAAETALAKAPPPASPSQVVSVRTERVTPPPASAQTQAATAAPEMIPLPQTRVAAAPANEPVAEPPPKPEFGVDLGGAPNLEVLAARWMAVKANFGPLLAGLHPLAAHDRRPGATDYRLLVGPLPDTAAAARLCGRFAAARITCRPAGFDGERIAQR